MHTLPETGYHCSVNNPVSELFYGRILLNHAFAFLFFDKESRYRHLIYQLKYHGRKEAGIFLGKLIGSRILEADFKTIDAIVPVPVSTKISTKAVQSKSFLDFNILLLSSLIVIDSLVTTFTI